VLLSKNKGTNQDNEHTETSTEQAQTEKNKGNSEIEKTICWGEAI
jgi:hypothetical protein